MKKLILPLCLTSSLVFAQDTVAPLPADAEAAVAAPVVDTSSVKEVEETAATEEAEDDAPLRVKSPMATFGVRGFAPDNAVAATPEDDGKFNFKKSHWVGTFGFEATKYVLPMTFSGATKSYNEQKRELWGGRLGIGREFYLGAGFLFQGRLEAYYMGTLFENAKTADPDYPGTDVSTEKDTGQMYGGDAIAHFGWMFDYKIKNPILGETVSMACEPFIEAGLGRGKSYMRKEYLFNASKVDFYDFIMEDDFTSTSVAAGLNFLSTTSGAFLTLKVTQMDINVDKRRIRSKSLENAAQGTSTNIGFTNSTINKPNIDTMTVFALSGGVKF